MHRLSVLALVACGATAVAPEKPVKPAPVPTANPCFAGKPALDAGTVWRDLEKYSWSVYLAADEQPPPPPTTYGSCTVERNQVTTASGELVAELGCGIRVLVPGIRDSLGLELGTATGTDVLDRWPKPQQRLTCIANGPDQTRCHFERPADSDTNSDSYVVAGALGADALTGDAARAFLADKRIVELHISMWCH